MGMASSSDVLLKLVDDYRRLYSAVQAQDIVAASRALMDFTVTTNALCDWIRKEEMTELAARWRDSQLGRVVADIGNTYKHHGDVGRDGRKAWSSAWSLEIQELTTDMTSISIDSDIPIDGWTFRCYDESGRHLFEVLDLAAKVVAWWQGQDSVGTPMQ